MGEFTYKNPITKGYSNQVRKPSGLDWGIKPVYTKGKVGAKLTGEFRKRLGPGVLRVGGTLNPLARRNKGKFGASYSIKW